MTFSPKHLSLFPCNGLRAALAALLVAFGFHSASAQSPYIYKVYEYRPAPGQFVNLLPEYEEGDTENDMRLKAEECLADDEQILVSLGAYGGYVVFGFDHMVENRPGEMDFKILGNAFYASSNPNPDAPKEGGSSEPGIVMVSYDANGNGRPDDPWYELAGSEYRSPQTVHHYEVTYYRPDENKEKTPADNYPYLTDMTYLPFRDNQGRQDYIYRNSHHEQPYYPQWVREDSLTFGGTKLADNYVDESRVGSYYVQYCYPWGYADNYPNTDDRSCLNIEWAVDDEGHAVQLPGIHFVKVYTGVNQYCGWLGETSTEIMGAYDLHLLHQAPVKDNVSGLRSQPLAESEPAVVLLQNPVHDHLLVATDRPQSLDVFNLQGQRVLHQDAVSGTTRLPFHQQPRGIYLLRTAQQTIRFIKQ